MKQQKLFIFLALLICICIFSSFKSYAKDLAIFEMSVDRSKLIIDLSNESRIAGRYIDTSKKQQDQIIKRIADSVESINKQLPIEKIYIHTDKNTYNIGDTIFFKAYVIERANQYLSDLNNIIYLQMSDDSANVIDRISIRMKNGIGWGQMAIRKVQYPEGNYILRAYNMWDQNFGYRFVFSKRFYLTTPIQDTWLVNSDAKIFKVEGKDQLQVSLLLNHADKQLSPVRLKDVEIKIYDNSHYFFNEKLRTGIDGSVKFSSRLKDKVNGRKLWVQLTSLDPIDTNKIVAIPLIINRTQKIDLKFLPEGGKLVTGLRSKVGFKAIGEDGKGADVAGSIFDHMGNKVADFEALHNGMGSFEFIPTMDTSRSRKPYTAKIIRPAGITEVFELPKVEVAGTVLHVNNPEASALEVTVSGMNSLPGDSGFTLVGMARGTLCYAETIKEDRKVISIDKKLFPTGVARFTLFKGLTPLNERVVFIDHQDRLQVSIKPHKTRYDKRDSVSLSIEVKDKHGKPVEGNFSLSVTDGSQVSPDTVGNFGIAATLLIGSELKGEIGVIEPVWKEFMIGTLRVKEEDLKGEIETPGYYISRKDKTAWQALDNLMLTQGWVDYTWKEIFAPNKKPTYPFQNTLDITGRVATPKHAKTVNKGFVMVSSQKPAFMQTLPLDTGGRFVVKDVLKLDTCSFFFQVIKTSGNAMERSVIILDRPLDTQQFPPNFQYPVLPWYVNPDTTAINLARRRIERANAIKPYGPGTILKEVNVKDKKRIRGSFNTLGSRAKSDYVFDEYDIKRSGSTNLYDFLVQNIPRLKLTYGFDNQTGQRSINFVFDNRSVWANIDGRALLTMEDQDDHNKRTFERGIEELSKYALSKIKGIEMMYDYEGRNSKLRRAMSIITYNDRGGLKNTDIGTASYRPLPITVPKIFYSPKYNSKATVTVPDYRSTVLWEPNIVTDKSGKATVSFYNSDSMGKFIFNLQGVSYDGGLVDL